MLDKCILKLKINPGSNGILSYYLDFMAYYTPLTNCKQNVNNII